MTLVKHRGRVVDTDTGQVYGIEVGTHADSSGYRQIYLERGVTQQAHRFIWEAVHGPIPEGMFINHLNGVKLDETQVHALRALFDAGLSATQKGMAPPPRTDRVKGDPMSILNLQKRARTLGRIRLGQKGDRGQPQKLDRFRLTSPSESLLTKVAELYGGEVQPWTPAGGSPAFEVLTDSRRLPIMVPPQPITQWFEAWRKSGCVHRCDGRTNVLDDELCDPEDPLHIEATEKPTTRLNVILRDVEGIGVWRVETKGWNAAIELPDVAEFLAQAGGYVNGWLALEQRTSVDNSQAKPVTRHFMVPIIEIDVTPAQLMAGKGRVQAPALEGPVPAQETPALAPAADPYAEFFAKVEAATDLDYLATLWSQIAGMHLVGHSAANNPAADPARAQAFVEAWKAKAHAIKAAQDQADAPPPAAQVPDGDGAVDAELVPDEGADADQVWAEILKAGGQRGMGLSEVSEDFKASMGGLLPDDASAAELQHYLGLLTERAA